MDGLDFLTSVDPELADQFGPQKSSADAQEQVAETTTDTASGVNLLQEGMKKLAGALNLTAPNSKPVNQDDYPVFDVTKFVSDAWGQVKGQLGKAQDELNTVLHGAQEATKSEKAALLDKAQAQIDANNVKAAADIQQKADVLKDAAMYGTTPGAPSEAIAKSADAIQKQLSDYTDRAEDIRQRAKVGLLDDPVQWLVNQVVIPKEQQTNQALYAGIAGQQSTILQAQTATLQSAKIATATDAADAQKLTKALNDEAFATAKEKSAAADEKMAQLGLQGVSARDAINKTQFDMALNVTNAQIAFQNMISNKMKDGFYVENARSMMLQRLDKMQNEQDFTGALDALNKSTGLKLTLQGFKLMDRPHQEQIASALSLMQYGMLGASPGGTFEFLKEFNAPGNVALNLSRDALRDAYTRAQDTVKNSTQYGGKTFQQLKPEDRVTVVDGEIKKMVQDELSARTIDHGLYMPGPVKDIMPMVKTVAPGLAKLMEPEVANAPAAPLNPQSIFAMQKQRVEKGEISAQDAAKEIANVFKGINSNIYATRGLRQLGIQGPTDFKFGLTLSPRGSTWNSHQNIDLTSESQVQHAITTSIIKNKALENMTGNALGGGL